MSPGRRIAQAVSWRLDRVSYKLDRQFKRVQRKLVRLERSDILCALQSFGALKFETLFVHSSLSACGHIMGGPQTAINSLLDWVEGRSLAMPTHSYCYPDESGNIRVYRANETPSQVGAISDYFWRQPGVVRSNHPTHSVACVGSTSESLLEGHDLCDTPCGKLTPYDRMVGTQSAVLMFGARLDAYTLFHTAEDEAKVPYLYEPRQYTLRVTNNEGAIKSVPMWRQDSGVRRRFAQMDHVLETSGLLVRRKLGFGELLFVPNARSVHQYLVEQMHKDTLFLVAESARMEVATRLGL